MLQVEAMTGGGRSGAAVALAIVVAMLATVPSAVPQGSGPWGLPGAASPTSGHPFSVATTSPASDAPTLPPVATTPGGTTSPTLSMPAIRTPVGLWVPSPPTRGRLAPPTGSAGGTAFSPSPSYSAEPAPMGVADYGTTSGGKSYVYSTPRVLASAQVRSLAVRGPSFDLNSLTFQLNVVLVISHGSSSDSYWIQDVPFLNTSTREFTIIDNVWNGSGSSLPSSSVRGNGTVSQSVFYYDVASTSLPGSDIFLTYPANFSVEVVASVASNVPHVAFEYSDGFGWVTYDNVSFPWAKGWTTSGFLVDGSASAPIGIYYDSEWVLGGPGGGSSTTASGSNVSLDLEEWNGHDFTAVPHAFNFGGDTAETIGNVVVRAGPGADLGRPGAVVTAGSGGLSSLYGPGNVAILNASGIATTGALLVNGSSSTFTGGALNVSFFPGSYRLDLTSASTHDRVNLTVLAGELLPTVGTLLAIPLNVTTAPPGALVGATVGPFPVGDTIDLHLLPSTSNLAQASAASNGFASLSFRVPALRYGFYGLLATDPSSSSATGVGSIHVRSNLTVALAASVTSTEATLPVNFTASASGGFQPITSWNWSFGDGSSLLNGPPTTSHRYASGGSYLAEVVATDEVGTVVNATVLLTISPAPAISGPVANRSSADVGQKVSFDATITSGSGGYTFQWRGLPGGCVTAGNAAVCAPVTAAGNFAVILSVTDSAGVTVNSSALGFPVYADPVATAIAFGHPGADVGESVSLFEAVTGGAPGPTFRWSGLPNGACLGGYGDALACSFPSAGLLSIDVVVTDTNGLSSTAPAAAFRVSPALSLPPVALDHPVVDVGQSVNVSVAPSGGSGGDVLVWASLWPGCAPGDVPSFSCAARVLGSYYLSVTDTDSNGVSASAHANLLVAPTLAAASVRSSRSVVDVGQQLVVSANVTGGSPDLTYEWQGLPAGCLARNASSLPCGPATAGRFAIALSVVDLSGSTVSAAPLSIEVGATLVGAGLSVDPSTPLAGAGFGLNASVAGGVGPYAVDWIALPAGCSGSPGPSAHCPGLAPGDYGVSAVVTDAAGAIVNDSTSFTVAPSFLGLPAEEGYAVLVGGIAVGIAAAVVGLISLTRSAARREAEAWEARRSRGGSQGAPSASERSDPHAAAPRRTPDERLAPDPWRPKRPPPPSAPLDVPDSWSIAREDDL